MASDYEQRALWAEQSAHTRARQLEATRERLRERLLTLATLAHNTDEYPDVRARLADGLDALLDDAESGALFRLASPAPAVTEGAAGTAEGGACE